MNIYDHDGNPVLRTCCICGNKYHIDGPEELYEADSGETVCEGCVKEVVMYSINCLESLPVGRFYGECEYNGENFTTKIVESKKEARTRLLEVMDILYPGMERIEHES
jgi:hypothetical protein